MVIEDVSEPAHQSRTIRAPLALNIFISPQYFLVLGLIDKAKTSPQIIINKG